MKPTESELEILQILWQKKSATVREVHEALLEHKSSVYTTTLKLLQIMFEKGLVHRNDEAKSHVYAAAVTKATTQQHLVSKMIESVFNGSPKELVMQALGSSQPSAAELAEIEQLIAQLKNN